ncbi:MAG: zinc-dependent alcohol dehydrogenase family protein [Bacillota bacterium]|nr:zinc-dependent alcohol dehydrogenase family protein [Bacillota bacterium]
MEQHDQLMQAVVYEGPGRLRLRLVPRPKPGPGELLVGIEACGICGTDLHIYGGAPGAAPVVAPRILGHEFAGRVQLTGPGVTDFRPGDLVTVDPNDNCGACPPCRAGLPHFCTAMRGIGTTVDGAFARYTVVPAKQALQVPDTLDAAAAAMTEPLACCLHGIDRATIRPGDDVLIIGAGMIGLLMLQLARLSGAARTAVLEPQAARRRQAEALGATVVLDPRRPDGSPRSDAELGAAFAVAGIRRFAASIECAGQTATMEQAFRLCGFAGTVLCFGLTGPDDEMTLRPYDLFSRELTLTASYINPATMARALDLIAGGRIDVTSMIAGRVTLAGLPDWFRQPAAARNGKYIVVPG